MRKDWTMKRILFLLFVGCFLLGFCHNPVLAEEFLGAPVIQGGKILLKTKKRLEIESPLSHDQVVKFYEEALKDKKDIKFRNWPEDTYIEDDSNLPWHSITISKTQEKGMTSIVILKDNWTWIIGTLILRFIGVFVVLLILFLGMSVSGSVISRSVKRMEATKP
jgi:hypothetical protein